MISFSVVRINLFSEMVASKCTAIATLNVVPYISAQFFILDQLIEHGAIFTVPITMQMDRLKACMRNTLGRGEVMQRHSFFYF